MSLSLVLEALREPTEFAHRWGMEREAPVRLHAALAGTAALGVGLYGGMLHAWQGALPAVEHGIYAAVAAGIGWSAALPSLVILGGLLGSKLAPRAALLASLVTVSFGGLALLASIPVLWFFELSVGGPGARAFVACAGALGVGACMIDVFTRVMARLEGSSFFHWFWFGLFGLVTLEMLVIFGVHQVGF